MSKILLILFFFTLTFNLFAEDKILTSPLINLEKLKPSFEETDESTVDYLGNEIIKNKDFLPGSNSANVELIGLDKITAKTSKIKINMGETKNFGPLEIKVLKCGKIISNNIKSSVAYLQVKDSSDNQNEKVFIFNGWTFASDPALTPFDHAIYDLQLLNCNA